MFVVANQVESALWLTIAVVMIVRTLRRDHVRLECVVAAVAFTCFGVSDLVEATTGAWWRPWWLLVWKAACVATLLFLLNRYLARRKRSA